MEACNFYINTLKTHDIVSNKYCLLTIIQDMSFFFSAIFCSHFIETEDKKKKKKKKI